MKKVKLASIMGACPLISVILMMAAHSFVHLIDSVHQFLMMTMVNVALLLAIVGLILACKYKGYKPVRILTFFTSSGILIFWIVFTILYFGDYLED